MRAWIVGNGESLTAKDLDTLYANGETSFACGRINLMYNKTRWRPDYYVQAEKETYKDRQMRSDFRDIIANGTHCYIEQGMVGFITPPTRTHGSFELISLCRDDCPTWHLPELCFNTSSLHVAMQIATNLGYSPLYLLGVDIEGEHFSDDYQEKTQPTRWRKGHRRVPEDVMVYNASRSDELEVYPKVDIEEVLHAV